MDGARRRSRARLAETGLSAGGGTKAATGKGPEGAVAVPAEAGCARAGAGRPPVQWEAGAATEDRWKVERGKEQSEWFGAERDASGGDAVAEAWKGEKARTAICGSSITHQFRQKRGFSTGYRQKHVPSRSGGPDNAMVSKQRGRIRREIPFPPPTGVANRRPRKRFRDSKFVKTFKAV